MAIDSVEKIVAEMRYVVGPAHEPCLRDWADRLAALAQTNAVEVDGVRLDIHDLLAYYRTAKANWDTCLKERDEARARADRLAGALGELVGMLEIAAIMPEATGKAMHIAMDDPLLEMARAALTPAKEPTK